MKNPAILTPATKSFVAVHSDARVLHFASATTMSPDTETIKGTYVTYSPPAHRLHGQHPQCIIKF